MKDGTQTTEFWGKCIMQLAMLAKVVLRLDWHVDDQTALLMATSAEGLYMTWRGALKCRHVATAAAPAAGATNA